MKGIVGPLVETLSVHDIMSNGGFEEVRHFRNSDKHFTVWEKFHDGDKYVLSVADDDDRIFFFSHENGLELDSVPRVQFANTILTGGDLAQLLRLAREITIGAPANLTEFAVRAGAGFQHDESKGSLAERYIVDPFFRDAVHEQTLREQAKRFAMERVEEEALHQQPEKMWNSLSAKELVEQEKPEVTWRVKGLLAAFSNAIIVAAAKVGKTTFLLNLIHALLTGKPFLGRFASTASARRIGLLNFELTEQQCQQWLNSRLGENLERLQVWNLRGKLNPLGTAAGRKKLAAELRDENIGTLIIDPFSGAFRRGAGASQDNDSVKEFLMQLDEMKLEAGVDELIIAVHAGRNTARTRGASSLDDHPDSLWYLEHDFETGLRKFHATGRDVEVEETFLEHDSATRVLTVSNLSLSEGRALGVEKMVLSALADGPLTASQLVTKVGKREGAVNAARNALVERGVIIEELPGGGKKVFRLA